VGKKLREMEGSLASDVVSLILRHIPCPLELRPLMRVNRWWHGAVVGHLVRTTDKAHFDVVFAPFARAFGQLRDAVAGHDVYALLLTPSLAKPREFVTWYMAAHSYAAVESAYERATTRGVAMKRRLRAHDQIAACLNMVFLFNSGGLMNQLHWCASIERELATHHHDIESNNQQARHYRERGAQEMATMSRWAEQNEEKSRVLAAEAAELSGQLEAVKKRLKIE